MELKYYHELDGVRGIAALMVMFFHFFAGAATDINPLTSFLGKVSVFGQTGVTLFFVLSGFLITRILIKTKEKPNYFSAFYIKRSLRIFPLYYLVLIVYFFVVPILAGSTVISLDKQIYFWVYLQNIAFSLHWEISGPNHFWSLAVEEHFYLFWPIIIYFLNTKNIFKVVISILIGSLVIRFFLTQNNSDVFYNTITRMDALAMGSLISVLEINKKINNRNFKFFLSAFIIFFVLTLVLWVFYGSNRNIYIQTFRDTLLGGLYFLLIACLITSKGSSFMRKFFLFQPLVYSGKISYGLYVYHPFCFFLVSRYINSDYLIINLINSFLICFVIATCSYYFFELRFLKLKDKLTHRQRKNQYTSNTKIILE